MKKYLSIFLIFFLLFSVSFPAFAASNTPVPPSLDTLGYDSFAVVDAYKYYSASDPVDPAYACFVYDSSDCQLFYSSDTSTIRFTVFSYSDSAKPVYYSEIPKSSYDSSLDNNGWILQEGEYYQRNYGDKTVYLWSAVYSKHALDYYDSESSELTHNPFLLSNVDIYDGSIDTSTGDFINNGVFFSPIPPLVLETEKALTLFQNQTTQTILILLLCGVGCLALLISLVVLRKLFYRFLNK